MNPRPRSCLSTPLLSGKNWWVSCRYIRRTKTPIQKIMSELLKLSRDRCRLQFLRLRTPRGCGRGRSKTKPRVFQIFGIYLNSSRHSLSDDSRRHPFCLITIQFEASPGSDFDQATGVGRLQRCVRALRPADLLFRSAEDELVALLLNTERSAAAPISMRDGTALELSGPTVYSAPPDGTGVLLPRCWGGGAALSHVRESGQSESAIREIDPQEPSTRRVEHAQDQLLTEIGRD